LTLEDVIDGQINYPTAIWGVLRLGAVPTCANPTYTERELAYQLSISGAKYIVVQSSSFEIALQASKTVGIPPKNIIIIDTPTDKSYRSIDELVVKGSHLPALERIILGPGQSRKRLAFLSFSSGTSGLPKGVMISHGNLIANVCQYYEVDKRVLNDGTEKVGCGCLPFYHSTPRQLSLIQSTVSINYSTNL
jgi:acyl-CoA synthetase (AMP-forming)/AMP-acid ligase II